MEHRYTRNEVERMMGVTRRELDYWTRLRLVLPRARWGERFFNFSDLVALETIKRLAARKVPARRIRRAVTILQTELGSAQHAAFHVAHFDERKTGGRVSSGGDGASL